MREVVTSNTGRPRVWYHFCEELDGKMVFTSMEQLTGRSRNSIELLIDQNPQLVEAGLSLESFSFVARAPKPPATDSHTKSSGATVDSANGSDDSSDVDNGGSGESLPMFAGLCYRHASYNREICPIQLHTDVGCGDAAAGGASAAVAPAEDIAAQVTAVVGKSGFPALRCSSCFRWHHVPGKVMHQVRRHP